MKKLSLGTSFLLFILFSAITVQGQTDRPYTDGPLWQVQFVHTKPGMGDQYLKNLSEGWIKEMRAAKDAGLVLDFKVLAAPMASENDWDLLLMYELKNHAVLDGMRDQMEAISKKVFGTDETQHTEALQRNDLRVLQGGKLTQELIFK